MAEGPQPNGEQPTPHRFTWARATRDVVNHAISKGQLGTLALAAVVFLWIWKSPEESVGRVLEQVATDLSRNWKLGYALWVATLVAWRWHAKYQRKVLHDEIGRLSRERNEYQKKALGSGKVISSKPPKKKS